MANSMIPDPVVATRFPLAAFCLLALFLESPAAGQFTWDGSCGTDNWHSCCNVGNLVDNNWDIDPEPQCPPFPGPKDDVDLNGAAARISTRHVDIRNLFNGSLILQSFGLNVSGNVDLDALSLLGSDLMVGGVVNVSGLFTWRSQLIGPQGSPATIAGPIMLDGILNATLTGMSLTAQEPVSWTGSGGLILNGGATLRNNASFSMSNNEAIAGNGGTFINNAPFSKGGSTGTSFILPSVFFDNAPSGSIGVGTGTLSIQGSGRSRGLMNVNAGATLGFATAPAHTFIIEENTTVTGGGRVQLGPASGPFSVAAGKTFAADNVEIIATPGVNGPGSYEFASLRLERGTLGGAGVTTVTAPCAIVGNLSKTLVDHTLNLRGATTWNGTNFVELQLFEGGILNNVGNFTVASEPNKRVRFVDGQWINHPGSTMDILSNLTFIAGPGVFRNEGVLSIDPAGAAVDVTPVTFEQLSTLNLLSGTLSVGRGRANAARFNLDPNAVLAFVNGTFVVEDASQFVGEGIVRIPNNGVLEFQQGSTDIPLVELAGGVIQGAGTLNVIDRLLWTSGTMGGPDTGQTIISGELDIPAIVGVEQRTVTARGVATLDPFASISLAQAARFVIGPTGVFTANRQAGQQRSVFVGTDGSDVLVLNAGELLILGDGPSSAGNFSSTPLDNRGRVDVQNVQVSAASGGSSVGAFNIGFDSTMFFGGDFQWNTGTRLTGSGTAAVLGVIVNGEIDAENINLSRVLKGPGTLRVASNLRFGNGRVSDSGRLVNLGQGNGRETGVRLTLDNSIFENRGNAEFFGDLLMSGASLVINSGAFRVSGDIRGPGASAVHNFGNFLTISADSVTIEVPFSNLGGVVTHQGAVLRFAGPYSQTAAGRLVNEDSGGTIVFDQPPALSRGTRVEGRGVFRVAGQVRSPAQLAPGASAGRMTIEAEYIQEPDGVLEIEIGGRTPETEHDVFEVIGNATLAGTLDLRLIDGFQPVKGDRFTILTCTTRTGEFDSLILPTAPTAKQANWRVEYAADRVDLVFDG